MNFDLSIGIATINGSGSQSANNILLRSLFRMGLPVGGKNVFPSNIAGLPSWFFIRANSNGFISRRSDCDIFVNFNPQTISEDQKKIKPGGLFLYNSKTDLKIGIPDVTTMAIDLTGLAHEVSDSIKLKKLLANMIYVGVLSDILNIPENIILESTKTQFKDKLKVFELNEKAAKVGIQYAKKNINYKNIKLPNLGLPKDKILMDGNTAAGLGLVYGGCTFMSWYPITPSSSLAESFIDYSNQTRKDSSGKLNCAIVQAEDELAAITMVAGAGWAGARACTATSGPGVSLMSETAGLMYFAEVPGVIWDVQRAGPSTGLPTRTLQGDVFSAATLSHGDTKHPILFPSSPTECFEFAQTAFDLADRLQTLVFVLSDLDLGMNYWVSDKIKYPEKPFDRGKVLTLEDLNNGKEFKRYKDIDGDGIPFRTFPGLENDNASFFTRGTGHDESSKYTEDSKTFELLLERLNKKFETAKNIVPKPIVEKKSGSKIGVIYYGSTEQVISEFLDNIKEKISTLRLRAYPFNSDVEKFIQDHEIVFVIEQNRDAQMKSLIQISFPKLANRLKSILSYDGMPISVGPLLKKYEESKNV